MCDVYCSIYVSCRCFFFQAEDGIRDLVRSRGLGDVYKRQPYLQAPAVARALVGRAGRELDPFDGEVAVAAQQLSLIHI